MVGFAHYQGVVKGPCRLGLDSLCRVPLQGDAGESPDSFELLVSHQLPACNGVGNTNRFVGDLKDGNTVVGEEGITYNG